MSGADSPRSEGASGATASDGPPFQKILIANRGEIAVRIMQTCREMGIRTVAIYSTADAGALHVLRSDEAFCVGPPSALESYLNIDAILTVARQSGAEAVHPGYGFLAENARFAQAVQDSGLTWIGPAADVIARMGDKVASKELAISVGVPVVPGYFGEDQSLDRVRSEADRIGYPVMIKAAAGGGGKGMRAVDAPEAMESALEGAQREAHSAFGDSRVFLEKLLVRPRHIEIQLIADLNGEVITLGERDCSIQRRHQKVMEESPSPVISRDLREGMSRAATRLARKAGYTSAGTVEFLFTADSFYFLEMNTRIQVEHPVTEAVTGLDLVRLQIDIAAGRPMGLSQLDVEIRGHAIEARLYAEDPLKGFLPAAGTLAVYDPPEGPGIRNDVGVFEGVEISPFYDPILAKVVVHGVDRSEAVARLHSALQRYAIAGVTTNLGFLQWIVAQDDFRTGRAGTDFIERRWLPDAEDELPIQVLLAAAGYELVVNATKERRQIPGATRSVNPWSSTGGWRVGGGMRTLQYQWLGKEYRVDASFSGEGSWRMSIGDESRVVQFERTVPGIIVVRENSRALSATVAAAPGGITVGWEGTTYTLVRPQPPTESSISRAGGAETGVSAPMPGTVVKVAVGAGQRVSAHEPLVVLEAMKMEHVIEAPYDGVVHEVLFREGDLVPAGSPLVRLEAS